MLSMSLLLMLSHLDHPAEATELIRDWLDLTNSGEMPVSLAFGEYIETAYRMMARRSLASQEADRQFEVARRRLQFVEGYTALRSTGKVVGKDYYSGVIDGRTSLVLLVGRCTMRVS